MTNEEIKIYKTKDSGILEIALNFDVEYNPANAISKINGDLDESLNYNAENFLNTDNVNYDQNTTMHPDNKFINDYKDLKDMADRPIKIYNWDTKENAGFPFIEAFDYNLDKNMFILTIQDNIDFIVKKKQEIYKYKPILLVNIDE